MPFLVLFFVLGFNVWPVFQSGEAKSKVSAETLEQIELSQEETQRKLAEAMNLLEQMRQEFQQYRGSIDQGVYLGNRHQLEIEALQGEMKTLQDHLHLLSAQLDEILEAKFDPKLLGRAKTEADAYLLGLEAYNAGNFKSALQTWKNFLLKYPKSRWKPGALYWIAEIDFQQGNYQAAIQGYQKVIQAFPTSDWTAKALFKQGLSFFKLQDYESALAFFEKVSIDYRKSGEGWRAVQYEQDIRSILEERALKQKSAPVPSGPTGSGESLTETIN